MTEQLESFPEPLVPSFFLLARPNTSAGLCFQSLCVQPCLV
jgi:hypothetical protein